MGSREEHKSYKVKAKQRRGCSDKIITGGNEGTKGMQIKISKGGILNEEGRKFFPVKTSKRKIKKTQDRGKKGDTRSLLKLETKREIEKLSVKKKGLLCKVGQMLRDRGRERKSLR